MNRWSSIILESGLFCVHWCFGIKYTVLIVEVISLICKGPDQNSSNTTCMRVYPPNKQTQLHHRQEITDLQKGRILEARGLGKSYTKISEELHITQSTVVYFLH